MQCRRSIQLLELLIAFVIMGFILEMLFFGYRYAANVKEEIQYEKELVLGRERLLRRLQLLFKSVQSCQDIPEKGFLLKYQGGIDPDPHFRGTLDGYLYLDHHRLTLVSWPEKENPRTEVLYEAVKKIELSFFDSKTGQFQSSFPESKPFMMKAILTLTNDNELTIPLFL